MNDPADDRDLVPAEEPPPPAPRKKGRPVFAWGLIVLAVLFILLRPLVFSTKWGGAESKERLNLLVLKVQGRFAVGAAQVLGKAQAGNLYQQLANALGSGPLAERLRLVVLAGELEGPKEALARLQELQQQLAEMEVPSEPDEIALMNILERLYRDYSAQHPDAPSLREDERDRLREQLGWFGQLALTPDGRADPQARQAVLAPARRTYLILTGGLTGVFLLGMAGLTGLCLFLAFLFSGRLRSGISGRFENGSLYAETFAVWMLLFEALSVAAAWVSGTSSRLLLAGGVSLVSLVALAWPVLRGVPWWQVRQDVGLTLGRNPALEPLIGVGCYAMAIPLVFVGALIMAALMALQKRVIGGPVDAPSHPVVQIVSAADWRVLVQLVVLACVVAPIAEETMFRGVLYCHLRAASTGFSRIGSILFSALVVSILFALIHPQGWMAVPVLAALVIPFSLVREWRGTLVPSMVAHAMNNGLVALLLSFVLLS